MIFRAKIIGSEVPEGYGEEIESKTSVILTKLLKEAAKSLKLASEEFKLYNFSKAIDIYRKWIEKLENARLNNDEEENKQKQMLIKMYQNVCVCYNKINKPEKSCVMMRELEKLTPISENPKALYAKAKANMLLNNFNEARRYFMIVNRLTPNDAAVSEALKELNRRENAKIRHEKEEEELARKFQSEAVEMAKERKERAEERRREQDNWNHHLDEFKNTLKKTIEDFKENDTKRIGLATTEDFTHHHIEIAEEMCQQNGIELKGVELLSGGEKIYYLCK